MLKGLLATNRIVLLLGAGGVGKTTSSIALAFVAAMEGKTVALLSIDPARRLAAALGIPLGYQLQEIPWPKTSTQNPDASPPELAGRIFAGMLDQKAVFDQMVLKHAPSPEIASKILKHPIYQSASTNISGPIEYMALAKLQELADDPLYDLIIVDTPPDTHALDFLARPNLLAGFMEQGVLSWLIKPFLFASRFGLARFLNSSEKLMGGLAKVTGFQALTSFAEFLVLTQEIIEGFHRTGEKIVGLLHQPDTAFVLVMVPTGAASRSVLNIHAELQKLGYPVELLIVNRAMPSRLIKALGGESSGKLTSKWLPWIRKAELQDKVIQSTLSALQKGDSEHASKSQLSHIVIDEQERDLGDFQATYQFALEFVKKINTHDHPE